MQKVKDGNHWDSINMLTNSSVSYHGLFLVRNKYYSKYAKFVEVYRIPGSEDESYEIHEKVWSFYREMSLFETLIFILACTSIETIINGVGIHVYSEKFYKKNIERQNILSKINILISTINKIELKEDTVELKLIDKLFQNRNSLVHPKAKKITNQNMQDSAIDFSTYSDKDVIQLFDDFDRIMHFFRKYELICEIEFNHYNDLRENL